MAIRLSRRKIAAYYADELLAGRREVAKRLGAFLLDARRMRELPLIIRDIEDALATRGLVVADVASAHSLSDPAKKELDGFIRAQTGAQQVQMRTHVDESLLGGVRVNLPGSELDATIRHKLSTLKAHKL